MTVVLVAHPDQLRRPPRPGGTGLTAVGPDPALLRGVLADPHAEVPADGGAVLVLRSGLAVAAAGWTAVELGTSEVVGVRTVPGQRRRGFGALAVHAAATAAGRAGADLVWLRTHDVAARRLYAALGFTEVDHPLGV